MRILAVIAEGAIELVCIAAFLTVIVAGFGLAMGHI